MSAPPGNESVTAVAERFFPGGVVEPIENHSWLAKAETADGNYSVRQLDPGLPAARIALVHEYLARSELQHATLLVKDEQSGAQAFDARVWFAGAVVSGAVPGEKWRSLHLPGDQSVDRLSAIAAALGTFHRTGTNSSLLARAPRFRIREWMVSIQRSLQFDERALSSEIRRESRARRWLTASRPLLANAEAALEQTGYLRDEPLVIAHLDLWGSHIVLRENDSVTFLDCSTIGAAPQIVDLSQLIARSGAWSDDRVELALNQYATTNAISPLQRRVLPWLTALDAVGSCGHLLVRAGSQRDPLSEPNRRQVLAAADLQLELLQSLASAFVPPPARPYRRQGRRRERPAR